MKERRSLVEGLTASSELKEVEAAFVFGGKSRNESAEVVSPLPPPSIELQPEKNDIEANTSILPHMKGRIPVTTRCRPEVASALKRASLSRQLQGIEPYYVQDILEEAIESWLKQNGVVLPG